MSVQQPPQQSANKGVLGVPTGLRLVRTSTHQPRRAGESGNERRLTFRFESGDSCRSQTLLGVGELSLSYDRHLRALSRPTTETSMFPS